MPTSDSAGSRVSVYQEIPRGAYPDCVERTRPAVSVPADDDGPDPADIPIGTTQDHPSNPGDRTGLG